MPRVQARVLETSIEAGHLIAKVQFDKKLPNKGQLITVRWGSNRSLPQNALYWVYLNWLIDVAGLKDQGHFFAECLHDNLKKHLLSTIKSEGILTTTDLNKMEFGEYFDRVDKFIQEFFEIDTSPFWEEHRERSGE